MFEATSPLSAAAILECSSNVTLKIRQRQKLEEIVQWALDQVRDLLQTDRVLIYRCLEGQEAVVAFESVGLDGSPLLGQRVYDPGFQAPWVEHYGLEIHAETIAPLPPLQGPANRVVPIFSQDALWGLLTAQYCHSPHDWQPLELQLLLQIALQLGIAVQQSELRQQLQKAQELTKVAPLEARLPERSQSEAPTPNSLERQDITERKLAESRLQESQENLHRILAAISDGILVLDQAGLIQFVNPAANQMLGADLLGYQWRIPVGESSEIEISSGDGAAKILEMKSSEVIWMGQIAYVVAIRDISKHKRTDLELQSVTARLGGLLSQTSVVIFSCRAGGDYGATWMSENVKAAMGYEPQDFLADPDFWLNHVHPEDRNRILANLPQIFITEYYTHDYRFRYADGTYHWVTNQLRLIRDQSGKALEIIGSLVDITERKRSEELMRQSEARYLSILQDQTELITRFQLDGTLLFVNDAFCRYYGVSQAQIIGQNYKPKIYPEDQLAIDRCLAALSPEQPVGTVEHRVIVNDQVRWMQWTNRAIYDSQGTVVELQSVGRDIHDRKQAELQVQTALAEKEILLQEVYHRVKNNLQLIQSMLRMQQRRLKHPEAVQALQESGNRLMAISLVHETLYQSDNLAMINLADYVPSLVRQIVASYDVPDPTVQIQTQVSSILISMKRAICCGLILNELLVNALKYAFPEGREGQIMVELQLDQSQEHPAIVMTVKDNGIGLPEAFQLSRLKTLGLNLVQDFVSQLGGVMVAESNLGAQFRITFQVAYQLSGNV